MAYARPGNLDCYDYNIPRKVDCQPFWSSCRAHVWAQALHPRQPLDIHANQSLVNHQQYGELWITYDSGNLEVGELIIDGHRLEAFQA